MPCPEKFRESLQEFCVEDSVIRQINEGYEELAGRSPKKLKAAYFKRALDVMNQELEPEKLQELLEWNACCKSGMREKASKRFGKENADLPLEEKLEKIKAVPYMGKPIINQDGSITVSAVEYWDGENYLCACSNFNKLKRDYSVSKNYCYCCAGHFKYHYELMLGMKLETVEIVSSPLDSDGRYPCVIQFRQV